MKLSQRVQHGLARAIVLALVTACVWVLHGLDTTNHELMGSGIALLTVALLSALLPRRFHKPSLQILLLSVELIALGVIGCVLVQDSIPGADARLPFLAAYLIAVLVSVVGTRLTAGPLGFLAGTMVLALGTVVLMNEATTLQPILLGAQLTLLATTSMLTAIVSGGLRREVARHELKRTVDREMKSRETAAAELVSFTQDLADSHSIGEIADHVLRHLRHHTEVGVRAVALESDGEEIAIWEEVGSSTAQQVERRRLRLQESLAHVGSNHILQRLQCHTTGLDEPSKTPVYRTAVDIPVKIGGRVAGVLLLADVRPAALPPDRIGILVDVARRTGGAVQRLERNRDHENRRTSVLLKQMREGVLLLGSEGQVLLANPAARLALQGCSEADIDADVVPHIGDLTLAELAQTPPGVARRFRATVQVDEQDQPTQLACTAISVLDQSRRVGTLVTLADITEEELTRGRIIQAEKMTLVGQTLAGVAHELNNPLAALIGYADLLRMLELPEEVAKPVNQMREQAHRATRIVRNLLNFARRRNPERVPTSVADLINGTVELFAYEARMAGVEVSLDIAEELPPVLADKHALQQVLVNLVQNALHALETWEGSRHLMIRATPDPDGLLVSVTDSGPGVPAELRRRVFESFFTTKGQTKGTGLGLALSRTIAQEHGGDLLLAPGASGGACFSLRLPRYEPGRTVAVARGPGTAPGAAAATLQMPGHILVVDDEASVRETLVAQLGNLGAAVDSAANAIEAERMIQEKRYDALVVDIRMPGSSGLELHARIAERDPFLADRVVFMTGDFVNGNVVEQVKQTGRFLLEKPFTMSELTAALAEAAGGMMGDGLDLVPDITPLAERRSA